MRKSRVIIVTILALVMLAVSISGCTQGTATPTPAESTQQSSSTPKNNDKSASDSTTAVAPNQFPISDEKITLTIMALRADNQPDWNDIYVWQEYEEMTNIHIDWIQVRSSDRSEKVTAALASGDMPDAFMRCKISAIDQKLYGDQTIANQKKKIQNNRNNELLDKIIEFITENLCDNTLSLDRIAEGCGISSSYLSRFFKANMECTTMQYVESLRMDMVKDKLINTNNSLKNILAETGYIDQSGFIRRFKN